MIPADLKRRVSWWPALAVATVVVLSGARLVTLSMHERAAQLRSAAEGTAARHTRLVESELQRLLERTRAEARRALGTGAGPQAFPAANVVPGRHSFWATGNGTVLRAGESDAAIIQALAREGAASGTRAPAVAGLIGPVRYGSQWLVAAQAPINLPQSNGAAAPDGAAALGLWAMAYENLDQLLLTALFGELVGEGYDFELLQRTLAGEPRVFLSSRRSALDEPVTRAIRPPGGFAAAATPYLELTIRPRSGWYPAQDLAAEIGLLVVLAWALAFGTHDLTHSLHRLKAALATSHRRLRFVNARLVAEIEQHQALQRSLEHARHHDPSTGLPNRRYFMDQVDRALRELRTRRRQRIAILLIDIDRFALINDTLGHTAGDELMLQVARRFAKVLGSLECLLARWGGDQLAVLLDEVDSVAALRTIVSALQNAREEPFALRKHRVRIATRIGFCSSDTGLQRAEEALREADIALSVAKRQQGPLIVEYSPGMGGAAASLVSLEADLHIALDRHEFGLQFQPIVDLRAGRTVGVETLLRWRHPTEGLLTPDRFLAIAEEAGVMVPVTRWIILRVCRLIAEWRLRLPPNADFYISVNLSAAALRDTGLRDHVAHVLEVTSTPPGYLKFELTEGGLVSNVGTAREVLDAFHGMGIELMLDDFGTGYSALSYLQLFPFDYVKIDRPFVNRTGSERANNAITAAIVQMSASLGLRAVAEVVETPTAVQALLEMGCNFGQGYFFSPPVEAEAALGQLRSSPTPSTVVSTLGAVAGAVDSPTLVVEDSPTLVWPDSPTLALEAAGGLQWKVDEDQEPSAAAEIASDATR